MFRVLQPIDDENQFACLSMNYFLNNVIVALFKTGMRFFVCFLNRWYHLFTLCWTMRKRPEQQRA